MILAAEDATIALDGASAEREPRRVANAVMGRDRVVASDLWQLHAAAAAAAGRCRFRACRGGARDGGAPRLDDALRERYPLSGEGAAAVLEHGGELPLLRCAYVVRTIAAGALHAAAAARRLRAGPAMLRRCLGWLLCLTRSADELRVVHLHPHSHSGRDGMPVADSGDAVLLALARPADARECRWIRGRLRARRVDQGADRAGLSAADRPRVSGDNAQSQASAAVASAAGCADFFRDCRAVACGGGFG